MTKEQVKLVKEADAILRKAGAFDDGTIMRDDRGPLREVPYDFSPGSLREVYSPGLVSDLMRNEIVFRDDSPDHQKFEDQK